MPLELLTKGSPSRSRNKQLPQLLDLKIVYFKNSISTNLFITSIERFEGDSQPLVNERDFFNIPLQPRPHFCPVSEDILSVYPIRIFHISTKINPDL